MVWYRKIKGYGAKVIWLDANKLWVSMLVCLHLAPDHLSLSQSACVSWMQQLEKQEHTLCVNVHVHVWSLANSKPGQVEVKFWSSHESRKESKETRGSLSWLLEKQGVHLLRKLWWGQLLVRPQLWTSYQRNLFACLYLCVRQLGI